MALPEIPSPLKVAANLTRLTLRSDNLASDVGLIALAKHPDSQLESLTLESSNLTDTGIKALAQLRKLTRLTVFNNWYVSDEGFTHLHQHIRLRDFGLYHMLLVSDRTIEALCLQPCVLQSITLHQCPHITDMSVQLLSYVHTLTSVDLTIFPK